MKQLVLFLFTAFTTIFAHAQTPVKLIIHHRLNGGNFAMATSATNNLGNAFNLSRLEYYMTKFTIVHNGGQLLDVSDEVVALVQAQDVTTEIDLGTLAVTNIEGIRFHIGVHTPVNNEDPSLYPMDHPLAPQSPSMHWGWASGYRFIAMEGMSGAALNQTLELHGLGNENYFETAVTVPATVYAWSQDIHINADYERGLENIDVSGGLIVHGSTGGAATLIANFRDYVFEAAQTAGVTATANPDALAVFPNPSSGAFMVELTAKEAGSVTVTDPSGRTICTQAVASGASAHQLHLETPGCYFVTLRTGSNTAVQQIVIN